MTMRTVAVKLKIPDNEAYTALVALKRLGVDVARLERAEIWHMQDDGFTDFGDRFRGNETLFNPNKHEMQLLEEAQPRPGEVWVEALDANDVALRMTGASRARKYIGWRLFGPDKSPAAAHVVREAAEKLLCNPAIERAILP